MFFTTRPFYECIKNQKTKSIFFEPLSGNNGDILLVKAMEYIFQQLQINPVAEARNAEIILINGGGTMTDKGPATKKLAAFIDEYPETAMIVAPSYYQYKSCDFSRICSKTKAPIQLFVRDNLSYEFLLGLDLPTNVVSNLSQDLAFELRSSSFIQDLQQKSSQQHILITLKQEIVEQDEIIKRLIDQQLYLSRSKTINCDISTKVSYDEFIESICQAKIIYTDRLHVGLLGHLLNKDIHFVLNNNVKIKGVYEYNLDKASNVQLHEV